ncbi:MAG: hypothetical protein NVS2B7_34500 [Herpetosiphon sp.]
MGFLDNLSKTLTTGTDRVKFEADKFQRTNKLNAEVTNLKTQLDTNLRQLGERAFDLHSQGSLNSPEVASLAQIIHQLRQQQAEKEHELAQAQNETFEAQTAATAAAQPHAQHVPIESVPLAGTSVPISGSVPVAGTTPYACPACGYSLPDGAVFCPNCGSKRLS